MFYYIVPYWKKEKLLEIISYLTSEGYKASLGRSFLPDEKPVYNVMGLRSMLVSIRGFYAGCVQFRDRQTNEKLPPNWIKTNAPKGVVGKAVTASFPGSYHRDLS